jgi:hypothetical protein
MAENQIEIVADVGSECSTTDGTTFTLNAIKAGTIAHTRSGEPVPFTAELLVVQTIGELGDEMTARLVANEHNGFSIDAAGKLDDPDSYVGKGISILFDEHDPACDAAAGCGITETLMADEQNIAEIVAAKLQIDTLMSKLAETEAIVAERTAATESLFTKEQMDEAAQTAIEASETKAKTIGDAKLAVKGMFPGGIDEKFEAEVMDLIEAEDYHGTVLKLGTVDFKTIVANVPSGETGNDGDPIEASETKTALDAAIVKLNSKYIGA